MNAIKFKNRFLIFGIISLAIFWGFASCDDSDDNPDPSALVAWNIDLNAKFENPAVPNRTETGKLQMVLYSDHSLKYMITVNNLSSGDALTMAHIHAGDPLTNGPVVLNFSPSFSGNTASGTLMLTETFVDSLLDQSNELYFNVHSQQIPAGLVRGQVNSNILFASDVVLSGSNEVPPVQTTATGLASIRLTNQKMLYSKVVVSNLEAGDSWTAAHIHKGASGVNGAVLVPLCDSATDFGVIRITTLNDGTIATLLNDSTYVNAHTTLHGAGAIRGQLKNASQFHIH